eukprot:7813542-Prorocentrum_lima.AAC.1
MYSSVRVLLQFEQQASATTWFIQRRRPGASGKGSIFISLSPARRRMKASSSSCEPVSMPMTR